VTFELSGARWSARPRDRARRIRALDGARNAAPLANAARRTSTSCARAYQAAEFEHESFDLVFSRWVFSFLSQPELLVPKLARLLKPRGVLALQDYHHEGIAV
jgi:trans-aconitate methyltransferase